MSLNDSSIRITDEKKSENTIQKTAMEAFHPSRISPKRNLFCPNCGKLVTRVSQDAQGEVSFRSVKDVKKKQRFHYKSINRGFGMNESKIGSFIRRKYGTKF